MKSPTILVDLSQLCSQAKESLESFELDKNTPVKEDPAQLKRLELFRRIKEQLDQLIAGDPKPSEP